jgi:DNA polymerase-1
LQSEEPLSPYFEHPSTLKFDIEAYGVEDRWRMKPRDYFRLGQYAWGASGQVKLTTDYDEMIHVIRQASVVIGHNIHSYDLSVLFGPDSTEPLEMALAGKVFDTMVHAGLVFPAPDMYVDRNGRAHINADKPEGAMQWLGLDNLAYQLGLSGKIGDLSAMAKKHGGFGNIPTDDPEYRAYAEQDVITLQELVPALLAIKEPGDYEWREQKNAAIDAQNSRNGWRVDIAAAQSRADTLSARKEVIVRGLEERYGFPTDGKMPWRSTAGKEAIMKALADQGITPETRPDWKKTTTGNISLGGEVLIELTTGTDAEDLGHALAEVMGQRTLSQLALDSVQPDGKVHPEITSLQRSGRKSTTKPGLTVWSSRGEKAVEKSYFIPNSDDELLVEFDYSQADARIVAALSGDEAFAQRFAEGVDAHELTGRVVFDTYDEDPYTFRQTAKALGHAWGYRAQAKKLALTSGQPLEVAEMFVAKMNSEYRDVIKWQDKVTAESARGYVVNEWGRVMIVEKGHGYTQAPALYGQSGTRELMVDALIRMAYADIRIITWLVAQVHDALVFSVPKTELAMLPKIKSLMETSWGPSDGSGQIIHFPVGVGEPAINWEKAGH